MPWIRFSLARPPHDDVLSQETSETSDLARVIIVAGFYQPETAAVFSFFSWRDNATISSGHGVRVADQ
jgi:hypothetical protein